MKTFMKATSPMLFVAALSLAGCGGSGGGTPIAINSPFEGRYSGTYSADGVVGNSGTASLTVSRTGTVSGTYRNDAADPGNNTGITGTLRNDGTFTGNTERGGTTNGLSGTFRKTSAGVNARLNLTSANGTVTPLTFTLDRLLQ